MSNTYSYSGPTVVKPPTLTNTTSTTVDTNKILGECLTFPKMLEDIHKYWKKLMKDYNTIQVDIANIERMFNAYGMEPVFYNVKEILQVQQEKIKYQIQQLEQQIYLIKCNFVTY